MEIRQLRYFVAILEAGSLRKAADQLYIAQTALGRQVKLLEEEFGKPLINRNARGISPTVSGQRLEIYARELLSSIDEIHKNMISDQQAIMGQGTIAAPGTVAHLIFGAVAERLASEQPEIGITFLQGHSYDILSGLEAKEIDVAIIIEPERHDIFKYEKLLVEPVYLVYRNGDSTITQKSITIADVAKLPVVTFRRGSGARNVWNRALARINTVPNIKYELGLPHLILDFVSRGLVYGILSAAQLVSVQQGSRFSWIPIEGLTIERILVRHKKSRNRAVEDILADVVRDEFLKLRDPIDQISKVI